MNYHTYIISLKENNEERRDNIQHQLAEQLEYTIVDAVVGSTIDKANHPRVDTQSQHLRAGQIGCALSHIQCYELAKKSDLDYVLICEDDFRVKSPLAQDLVTIIENLKGNSVCLLHWATFAGETLYFDSQKRTILPSGRSMYSLKSGRPLCATAYVCTREAYTSLLGHLIPLQTVADDWPRFLDKGFVENIFLVDPAPVDIQHFESQIGYGSGGGRLKKMAEWVKYKKIPLLKWVAGWHLNRLAEKNKKRVIV